ncbi:exonuclease SbcCD subunit D [Nodosilinea sp. PGN35]|uniref:exonuclease SbcCD subunit D n=1 Tax=Nodosilinea sp. PGN35 TaxID=3020489 RepID=UPI0023B22018|nr:exonuclease SbcCD subunit D [Nodosilinea sp. TSF1-S3]MDF0367041.1 exonuclease SbcCD subunit D [Nodosilinea sp. TSF1-S3]
MKLIHTADWHLGRVLKNQDRTPEIEFALKQILQHAKDLEVDAVLVAGDIFDRNNPPVEAERVAYNFFSQLYEAQIPAVVIAGNHDSSQRIDSLASILSALDIHALGKPRLASNGGVVKIETRSGLLNVGCMPFISEKRLLKSEDLFEKDQGQNLQHYRSRIKAILENLSKGFNDNSVNLVMAHLALDSALLSKSEREYECTGNYALSEQMLPDAQYIALGHFHNPQQISTAKVPAFYSGSLIQVDFGEANDKKGFNLIEVEPGRPAQVDFRELILQKPLKEIQVSRKELLDRLSEYINFDGWLKVIVETDSPEPDLAESIKSSYSQILHFELKLSGTNKSDKVTHKRILGLDKFNPNELFEDYWRDIHSSEIPESIRKIFNELYQEASEERL